MRISKMGIVFTFTYITNLLPVEAAFTVITNLLDASLEFTATSRITPWPCDVMRGGRGFMAHNCRYLPTRKGACAPGWWHAVCARLGAVGWLGCRIAILHLSTG